MYDHVVSDITPRLREIKVCETLTGDARLKFLRQACLTLSDPNSKRIENKMTGGCALLYNRQARNA